MERGAQREPEDRSRLMRIGELAAELGLNPKTIRYYEEIGLLPEPRRTQAGYRLYDAADRERLRFILKAKAVGLTLEEIKLVLDVRSNGQPPCAQRACASGPEARRRGRSASCAQGVAPPAGCAPR